MPQIQAPETSFTQTVTIGNGTSLSPSTTYAQGSRPVGLITPAGWATNAITFQVSMDDSTWFNLRDASAEYTLSAVVASYAVALDLYEFYPWKYFKVRSGTSGAPANVGSDQIITIVYKAL